MRINYNLATVNDDNQLLDLLLRKNSNGRKNRKKSNAFEAKGLDYSLRESSLSECYSKNNATSKLSKPGLAELEWLNFNFKGCIGNVGTLIHDGKEYAIKDFPDVEESWCEPIKMVDGEVNLKSGSYYKYVDEAGKVYTFASYNDTFSQPLSELYKSRQDKEARKIAKFWNTLSVQPVSGMELSGVSREEQRKYMENAGIEPNSFFTVRVGNKSRQYYYSDCERYTLIITKENYDYTYKKFTEVGGLKDYPVGSTVEVDGVSYRVSEHHNINVPYGVDIANFKMPRYDENYDWKKDPFTAKEDII